MSNSQHSGPSVSLLGESTPQQFAALNSSQVNTAPCSNLQYYAKKTARGRPSDCHYPAPQAQNHTIDDEELFGHESNNGGKKDACLIQPLRSVGANKILNYCLHASATSSLMNTRPAWRSRHRKETGDKFGNSHEQETIANDTKAKMGNVTPVITPERSPGYPHSSACCSQIVCRSSTNPKDILISPGISMNWQGFASAKFEKMSVPKIQNHTSFEGRQLGHQSCAGLSQSASNLRLEPTGATMSLQQKPWQGSLKTSSADHRVMSGQKSQMTKILHCEPLRSSKSVSGQRLLFSNDLPHPSKLLRHSRGRNSKRLATSKSRPKANVEDRILSHVLHIRSKQLGRFSGLSRTKDGHGDNTTGGHKDKEALPLRSPIICSPSLVLSPHDSQLHSTSHLQHSHFPHFAPGSLPWNDLWPYSGVEIQPLIQQTSTSLTLPPVFDQASFWQEDVGSKSYGTDCTNDPVSETTFELEQ